MDYFLTLDWSATFTPQLTLPEVLVRGTVVYFALLVALRLIPKWQAGPGTMASMLFVVMLGGLAADAVKGKTDSVTDILLMAATVMFWVLIVDRLSYRFPKFRFCVQDDPTCLVRNGHIVYENLRRESISEEDLKTELRRRDGSISVVKRTQGNSQATANSTSPGRSS
jgi:uncharacterized membrane protein YcaP (DUF421 family)